MIVADASVMVHALLTEGPFGEAARDRLADARHLHVPHLVDLEVASAARRLVAGGRVEGGLATTALRQLGEMELVRYPHAPFLDRVWELREAVTPYDAVYLALAEALRLPLLTADAGLASVPETRCERVLLAL